MAGRRRRRQRRRRAETRRQARARRAGARGGMALRLTRARRVASPLMRHPLRFGLLVVAVVVVHGCVTRDLAARMAALAEAAKMPPRLEVAYVRTLEPEAPVPVAAPAPAPPPRPVRRAPRPRPAPRPASAPEVAAAP